MEIEAKYNNKDVYSVSRLFSKDDMLSFVADGGLIRYKRLNAEMDRTGKEFRLDVKVSTFLSLFVIFVFVSMFLIYFSGAEEILISDIVRGFMVFIVPCIASVIALIKYTDYKEQLLSKATVDMEKFKEKHHVARRFSYEELENYSTISKKVTGIKGDLVFYKISECLLEKEDVGKSIISIYDKNKNDWYVLEYYIDNTRLETYKIYKITEDSPIKLVWK